MSNLKKILYLLAKHLRLYKRNLSFSASILYIGYEGKHIWNSIVFFLFLFLFYYMRIKIIQIKWK